MIHSAEPTPISLQQPLRRASIRRNLGTASIVAVAFSGGPFGLTWLATSAATTFLVLMLWRMKQQLMLP
jgi:hypothetical protein